MHKNEQARIALMLRGPVRIIDMHGNNLTPGSTKSRALLILLATSTEHTRGRRWIESMLWSQRSAEQAQRSLRQTLSEIRRYLKAHSIAIQSDRHEIWIDTSKMSITLEGEVRPAGTAFLEIAEGLVTKDPAFDSWLKNFRLTIDAHSPLETTTSAENPPLVFLTSQPTKSEEGGFLVECLNNQIAKNVSHTLDLNLRIQLSKEDIYLGKTNSFLLRTDVRTTTDRAHFNLSLTCLNSGAILWSERLVTKSSIDQFLDDRYVYKVAHVAAEQVARSVNTATANGKAGDHVQSILYRAIDHIFSFTKERHEEAEKLLQGAWTISNSPLIAAWLSFLYLTMRIEETADSPDKAKQTAKLYSDAALSDNPENAQILALVSQVELYLFGNLDKATRLAQDSLSINPGSPMALASIANTCLRANNISDSRSYAYDALKIASLSRHKHWWYTTCCYVDIETGDLDNAILNAENALAYSPNFRPPLRHLYALHLKQGNKSKAKEIARTIKQVDGGFSLRRVRENNEYPGATLRKSGLVESLDLHLLDPK